ncbi:hypothetical protein DFR24_4011 [Panacagrimonas perspica]|uniref:Uncharacterized protein n=1 Tax=Panacagrimonas perspica TaxID=381431 RepID=A0A4R7NWI1_9GAMM|nr:hypothetical protein [Panacagrimonas perspica]TDU25573.1 hypothetical protein DFR24_4011 [Panacagrimonas perspica]THD03827.1 hypothetical protein B1810_08120 [Panacagrimonas perspica]
MEPTIKLYGSVTFSGITLLFLRALTAPIGCGFSIIFVEAKDDLADLLPAICFRFPCSPRQGKTA